LRLPIDLAFRHLVRYDGSAAIPTDPLDKTFAALASPARRAMLRRLAADEATVSELAESLSVSLPPVSGHSADCEPAR
jgi:DNA-binding transcriptional ArsR family regulator